MYYLYSIHATDHAKARIYIIIYKHIWVVTFTG